MRRPWNIINSPVYSISTCGNHAVNMNICTYAMAISRDPKWYAIAIEESSKTLENIQHSKKAVLQIMTKELSYLIKPLGMKSGYSYDKEAYLITHDELGEWQGFGVLKNAAAWILLEVQSQQPTGDHQLFTCKALKYKTLKDNSILMFQDLIDQKLILK